MQKSRSELIQEEPGEPEMQDMSLLSLVMFQWNKLCHEPMAVCVDCMDCRSDR
jgi:hypothetical protein